LKDYAFILACGEVSYSSLLLFDGFILRLECGMLIVLRGLLGGQFEILFGEWEIKFTTENRRTPTVLSNNENIEIINCYCFREMSQIAPRNLHLICFLLLSPYCDFLLWLLNLVVCSLLHFYVLLL
jgi:hypothetical protein